MVTSGGIFHDPHNHTYHTLLNEPLVSNTDFLEAMGFSDYSNVPAHLRHAALEVGKDVHTATAQLDRGRGWREKFSHVEGWVAAWQKCKKDFKLKFTYIEVPFHDPLLAIATTPDRYAASMYGPITVQLKTGKVEDWVGLQLAFEEYAIALSYGMTLTESTDKRFAIELRSDGTYKPRRFTDPQDIKVYLGAVSYFRWMQNHNKNLPKGGNGL